MGKIRINDLARELEVKSKSILDVLPEVGVTEKKSHSSSLEDHEADKVRARLRASSAAQTSSRSSRPARADADEIKTKIDLSHISKPGDALKAIISKQQPSSAAEAPPAVAPLSAKPAVSAAAQRKSGPHPALRAAKLHLICVRAGSWYLGTKT
jgi:translation initiation factor IF-2